jgi:N-acetylneuraminic acid mutarotase
MRKPSVASFLLLSLLLSCAKEKNTVVPRLPDPILSTRLATEVFVTSATLNGELLEFGEEPVLKMGFVLGLNAEPTLERDQEVTVEMPKKTGPYSLTLRQLQARQRYYYRSFARTGRKVLYGSPVTFLTDSLYLVSASSQSGIAYAGNRGRNVMISGYNFSAVAAENVIRFGERVVPTTGVGLSTEDRAGYVMATIPEDLPAGSVVISVTRAGQRAVLPRPFQILKGRWVRKGGFPGQAGEASAFVLNGKGWVNLSWPSGWSMPMTNTFWQYDPGSDTWSRQPDRSGESTVQAGLFAANGKGYAHAFRGNWSSPQITVKEFWEYNPGNGNWTRKADFGGFARSQTVAFSIGSKGYTGTGLGWVPELAQGAHDDFWEYNPGADAWTQKASVPGGYRWGAVGCSLNGKGYIGMGTVNNSDKKDFWQYDPLSDRWQRLADFGGSPRRGSVCLVIDGKIYAGMGEGKTDWWEYDPAAGVWTQVAEFEGEPRVRPVGLSIAGRGYVGLGASYQFKTDLWMFDPNL